MQPNSYSQQQDKQKNIQSYLFLFFFIFSSSANDLISKPSPDVVNGVVHSWEPVGDENIIRSVLPWVLHKKMMIEASKKKHSLVGFRIHVGWLPA